MRSKTPLTLMEQLIMVLVFALAAALCLQAFALSRQISREITARDQALLLAQNTAETLKAAQGEFSPAALPLWYDENWDPAVEEQGRYCLEIRARTSSVPGLAQADVLVLDGPEPLICLPVAWQEEGGVHG